MKTVGVNPTCLLRRHPVFVAWQCLFDGGRFNVDITTLTLNHDKPELLLDLVFSKLGNVMLNVNEYFDGNVKSIGFQTETLPASVGVMAIGEYTFDTSQRETMTVVSGMLCVQLPSQEAWQVFNAGESFVVAANEVFKLKVSVETAYLCLYG